MKKILTMLLVTVLLFSSCGKGGETTEPATEGPDAPIGDETAFLLPELPDIGEYEADGAKRWYDGPMPELIPSDEYGQLYPYLGDIRDYVDNSGEYAGVTISYEYYGLCTADGTLVTDPIYTDVFYHDGQYLLKTKYAITGNDTYVRAFIAASDGSSVREIFHDHASAVDYCAPDVYGVVSVHALIPFPSYYLHADGTRYEADVKGNVTYDDGFLLHSTRPNRYDYILDKDLNTVGNYTYVRKGAAGEIICRDGYRYVILNTAFEELYSSDSILWYDEGRYMAESGVNELTVLDGDFKSTETVTFPSAIINVSRGYAMGREWVYTLSGEATEYNHYNEYSNGVLALFGEAGSAVYGGDAEVFISAEKSKNAYVYKNVYVYEDAVAIHDDDGYSLYDLKGDLIGKLDRAGWYGYTLAGSRRTKYYSTLTGFCEYTVQNGVYTTFGPDGRVLVKIHSDTE